MRFASRENTILSQWEVGAGLVPGDGLMARLTRLMGRGRALEVLLGADDIDGDLAQIYGYVNRSLPDSELDGFVDETCDEDRVVRQTGNRRYETTRQRCQSAFRRGNRARVGGIRFVLAASRHSSKNQKVDGAQLPQAR